MSLSPTERKAESHSCLDRNLRSLCEAGPKPDLGLVHYLFLGSALSAARCPIHDPRLAVTEKYLPVNLSWSLSPSPEGTGHFFLSLGLLELKHSPSPFLSVHHHFLNAEPHWRDSLFFFSLTNAPQNRSYFVFIILRIPRAEFRHSGNACKNG